MNLTDAEYVMLCEKIQAVTLRNFSHTMQHIEATLNISRSSESAMDRNLHFAIRGAILQHGKNLKNDVLAELDILNE